MGFILYVVCYTMCSDSDVHFFLLYKCFPESLFSCHLKGFLLQENVQKYFFFLSHAKHSRAETSLEKVNNNNIKVIERICEVTYNEMVLNFCSGASVPFTGATKNFSRFKQSINMPFFQIISGSAFSKLLVLKI